MRYAVCFRSAGLLALAASSSVAVAAANPLSSWNLIVRNDLHSTSEVDGSVLMGGSIYGTSNCSIHSVTSPNGDGLAIAGNIASGSIVQINSGGNLRISGSNLGTAVLNGGGTTISDPTVGTTVSAAFTAIQGISSYLSGLTPNGTLDNAGNLNATPTLINGVLVAVYSFNQSALQGLGQLNLNIGSASSVIINVTPDGSGNVNLAAPPNMVGAFSQTNSSKILWNFPGATKITVNNNLNGAFIAPSAELDLLGGGINGSVVVDNVAVQNAEIRANVYTGFVPAPGGVAPISIGGLIAFARRRR